jgi:hypothetical protein
VKRLAGWALPIVLAVAGVALIIVGSLDRGSDPATSLPHIARPTATPTPSAASPTQMPAQTASASPASTAAPTASATPTPLPDDVVAVQLEVPSVGINVAVRHSADPETDNFPPSDAAYILRSSAQPGRNTSSYVFAHAINTLFKPLWNVQLGDEVLVRMSDESVLTFAVTEVRPNVPCPDAGADPMPNPPLALQIHDSCEEGQRWLAAADHERLTLQTSQGFNRNWGELIVIAEPAP